MWEGLRSMVVLFVQRLSEGPHPVVRSFVRSQAVSRKWDLVKVRYRCAGTVRVWSIREML